MQNQLAITLIQTDIVWKDIQKNLLQLEKKINSISEKTDLIVLPEMFSTGFVMEPAAIAENMQGTAVTWMQKMAKEKKAALIGSLIIEENQHYFNRLLFVHPSGQMVHYDKKHLFTLAGEHTIYTPGENRLLFEYKGWKISPFVCYDLRFPVWTRNTENYDLSIFVANWPKARIAAWDTLLKARAIENMSYVVGVNRVGIDGNNLEYSGHSQAINPLGEIILKEEKQQEKISTIVLEKNKLGKIRKQFQFLNDQDNFTLN